MWSILLLPPPGEFDNVLAELWERGTAGVWEETGADGVVRLRAFFEEAADVRTVENHFRTLASDLLEVPVHAQATEGEGNWEPVYAGTKFVITPRGVGGLGMLEGRIVLEVNAAMAFGSGRHESTQLCLEALEQQISGGEVVVDVGCGSGILAMAAQKLGAGLVIACDIHEEATRTAREHFDGLLFRGSADGLCDGIADLALANISPRIDDRIAADLRRILKPDGRLVVSGFVKGQEPERYRPERELVQGDWLCWICSKEGVLLAADALDAGVHALDWWL